MGSLSINQLLSSNYFNDWFFRVLGMESNCDIVKFYSLDVNFNNINEYSLPCEIYTDQIKNY